VKKKKKKKPASRRRFNMLLSLSAARELEGLAKRYGISRTGVIHMLIVNRWQLIERAQDDDEERCVLMAAAQRASSSYAVANGADER